METISQEQKKQLGDDLLCRVSRSFYLSIKALPGDLRETIALAYLLARASDSIADAEQAPPEQRIEDLAALDKQIKDPSNTVSPPPLPNSENYPKIDSSEQELLSELPALLNWLSDFPDEKKRSLQKVLQTILSGQQLDLERFALPKRQLKEIISLQTEEELDDYCYRVAGCVGEFWGEAGELSCDNFFRKNNQQARQNQWGIDFGKALQYINIIRDAPRDLQEGRCYLPASAYDTTPSHFLDNPNAFHAAWSPYLDRCAGLLNSGNLYLKNIQNKRCALATALPLILALRTLQRLRESNAQEWWNRVKVPRSEAKEILSKAAMTTVLPAHWRRWERTFPELSKIT